MIQIRRGELSEIFINYNYQKAILLRLSLGLFWFFFVVSLGFIFFYDFFYWIIFILVGFAGLFSIFILVFLLRPRYVEIMDDGVMFTYIWKRKRFVKWVDIKFLNLSKGDLTTYFGSDGRGGVLCDQRWHFFRMNYELAYEVERSYIAKMGREPPRDKMGVSGLPS